MLESFDSFREAEVFNEGRSSLLNVRVVEICHDTEDIISLQETTVDNRVHVLTAFYFPLKTEKSTHW